jgi:hypothetical protein
MAVKWPVGDLPASALSSYDARQSPAGSHIIAVQAPAGLVRYGYRRKTSRLFARCCAAHTDLTAI